MVLQMPNSPLQHLPLPLTPNRLGVCLRVRCGIYGASGHWVEGEGEEGEEGGDAKRAKKE